MNFIKIGELAVTFDWSERYDNYEWTDKKDDLERESDLTVVTLKDGKKQLRAGTNFNGGHCACCGEDQAPTFFEFFKQVL